LAPYLRQPAIRAALCVPLVAWEKPLGVLNLTRLQRDEPFNGHTVEKIHLLTTQAALTLDRLEQEEQRRQQEKLATVGRLASTIVHDLRNPLQGVMGFAELLVLSEDRDVRKKAGHILKQAQRMTELCEDLMDYVRGQSHLHPELLSVATFLKEVTDAQETPDGITVKVKPMYTGLVSADPRKLRRALINLITNAYEAMPEGGTLRMETQADAEYVWFVVEDTGVGIPSDVQARLGEPFFTHGKTNGTGLGLAIVRSIAEAHGGRLCINSQVGRGTCVELGLPRPNGITADPTGPVGQGMCVELGRPLPEGQETYGV
jgi:two-component system sporulation sensor kinase A